MFKINFKLKNADDIVPWGDENDKHLHWFGLTDGYLWINAGDNVIYEYSDEAVGYFGLNNRCTDKCYRQYYKYNDYQLSRFIEDFFDTFKYVGESIPKMFYDNIIEFKEMSDKWHDIYLDKDEELYWDFFDNKYALLTEWYDCRSFDSGHLVGGPFISFLRFEDKIKIIWNSDYKLENGKDLWTSPKGVYEIDHTEFVTEVKSFINDFFEAMDKQVENVLKESPKNVYIDKKRLAEENIERKDLFLSQLNFLEKPNHKTDWEKITAIYNEMKNEIGSI